MTSSKSFWRGAAVLAVAALCSTPALATDFTFVVPVNVSHIPSDAYQMNIWCATFDPAMRVVGQQIVGLPLTDGAYSGDVTVAFNAATGKDPASAATYDCSAVFLSHLHPDHNYFARVGATTPYTFPLQPGAGFNVDTTARPLR
jgi:hypothetical protein